MTAQSHRVKISPLAIAQYIGTLSAMGYRIEHGFQPEDAHRVATLYWEAFGHKLGHVLGPAPRGIDFFTDIVESDHALVARDDKTGVVVGLAGYKTDKGALTGGEIGDIFHHYGRFGALWRICVLSLLERETEKGVLLLDGICVSGAARGAGVGTALLDEIKLEAARRGLSAVRLDVIDSNTRARALYERQGFTTIGHQSLGPMRYVFGFSSATRMRWIA